MTMLTSRAPSAQTAGYQAGRLTATVLGFVARQSAVLSVIAGFVAGLLDATFGPVENIDGYTPIPAPQSGGLS